MFRLMLVAILGSCFFLVDCLPCKTVKEEPKKEAEKKEEPKEAVKKEEPKKEEEKKEAVEVKEATVAAPAASEIAPTAEQCEKKE